MIRSPSRLRVFAPALALLAILATPTRAAQPVSEPEPLRIGKTFLTASLDPADGSAGWALVSHGIAEQLFTVARTGEIVPALAESASRNDDGSWSVVLAPGRAFSDGTPVDAKAVAAALTRTSEANAAARASAGRLGFEALDARTLRVTSERPTAILPSILAEWAFPVYRIGDDGPIFTGPYAVAAFEPGARLALVPNEHFPQAETRVPIDIVRMPDGQAMALAAAAGELDLAFNLPVESLPLLRADPDLTVRSFPVAYRYMAFQNTRRGPLADVAVRRAVDRALDRASLVAAIRAGTPATGAFAASDPFAADVVPAHDPDAARALLDRAGWLAGPDGIRVRNGERLVLDVVAYPQRPDLLTMQPVLRAALAAVGIGVETRVTETANDVALAGDFDLMLWAQHTAPAGDPGFFLSLFFATDAGRNYAGWSNPAYDALVEALAQASDPAERARLAVEAQALLAEEAPVAFLVTPEWHVALSPRLADYEPWGSDYYVVRADTRPAW